MDEGLKNKSEINLLAAQILHDKNFYDSVCHPAYYACLQLMSYKLIGIGFDLEKQAAKASSKYRGNSHVAILKEFQQYFKIAQYQDERLCRNGIRKLKAYRERADYKNERILQEESDDCITLAKNISRIINNAKP